MQSLIVAARKEWPKEIFVEPCRLEMGIWGTPEGDIQAAYSADKFPRIKFFVHDGQAFTNCGGWAEHDMNCYPLIVEADYRGPEPAQYTYEGQIAIHRGKNFRLGPCVHFIVRERTTDEWANLLQRKYAHGGMFAAGKTYREMLQQLEEKERIPEGERLAIGRELLRPDLPATQEEMLERLKPPSKDASEELNQLSLPGL